MKILALILALEAVAAGICWPEEKSQPTLDSSAFTNAGMIPARFTCAGQDESPPLHWSGAPGTKSFALVVYDPDASSGHFIHWAVYDLPADSSGLAAAIAKERVIPQGGIQALNDFPQIGYNGPCPPAGAPHHYHFVLYALAVSLHLPDQTTGHQLEDAMRGHIIATAALVATFGR